MNLFAKARSWIGESIAAAAGVDVTYTRGASSISITAVVGRVAFTSGDENGVRLEFGERDYLIEASALTFGEPALGDRITEVIDGISKTYEVITPITGEKAWRWSDPQETRYRIHVKKVS